MTETIGTDLDYTGFLGFLLVITTCAIVLVGGYLVVSFIDPCSRKQRNDSR